MVFNQLKQNGEKQFIFVLFLNTRFTMTKSRSLLFHVHMGTVRDGWIGCTSAVKIRAINNRVIAKTRFWSVLNIPTGAA